MRSGEIGSGISNFIVPTRKTYEKHMISNGISIFMLSGPGVAQLIPSTVATIMFCAPSAQEVAQNEAVPASSQEPEKGAEPHAIEHGTQDI